MSTSKQIHLEGLDTVQANINRLIKENWNDAKQGLREEANAVLAESVKQTPVEFGVLRRSGTVEVVEDSKKNFVLMVGFNTDYAAAVHENLNANHPKGKAKYLEDPLMARAPNIPKNIAKRIKGGMRV